MAAALIGFKGSFARAPLLASGLLWVSDSQQHKQGKGQILNTRVPLSISPNRTLPTRALHIKCLAAALCCLQRHPCWSLTAASTGDCLWQRAIDTKIDQCNIASVGDKIPKQPLVEAALMMRRIVASSLGKSHKRRAISLMFFICSFLHDCMQNGTAPPKQLPPTILGNLPLALATLHRPVSGLMAEAPKQVMKGSPMVQQALSSRCLAQIWQSLPSCLPVVVAASSLAQAKA